MKKFISLLICLVLLTGIIITANATNVNAIQSDTNVYIIGITDNDTPVQGHLYTHHTNGDFLILIPQEKLPGEYVNPITGRPTAHTEDNTEADTDTPVLPDDESQSIEYQIDEDSLGQEIFKLTNAERVKNGVTALNYNKDFQDVADLRAKEIVEVFAHIRPNGQDCFSAFHDNYQIGGENIIKADAPIGSAENIVNSWMNSEGHRENILLKEFTSIAVGVYEKDDVIYAVQIFIG